MRTALIRLLAQVVTQALLRPFLSGGPFRADAASLEQAVAIWVRQRLSAWQHALIIACGLACCGLSVCGHGFIGGMALAAASDPVSRLAGQLTKAAQRMNAMHADLSIGPHQAAVPAAAPKPAPEKPSRLAWMCLARQSSRWLLRSSNILKHRTARPTIFSSSYRSLDGPAPCFVAAGDTLYVIGEMPLPDGEIQWTDAGPATVVRSIVIVPAAAESALAFDLEDWYWPTCVPVDKLD